MSLINYIEPVNLGLLFIGIAMATLIIVFAYLIWRFFRPFVNWVEAAYNKESKYLILEEKMLDEIAKDKNINLDEELLRKDILKKKRKSFRNKVEEEMFKKMFGEVEEK